MRRCPPCCPVSRDIPLLPHTRGASTYRVLWRRWQVLWREKRHSRISLPRGSALTLSIKPTRGLHTPCSGTARSREQRWVVTIEEVDAKCDGVEDLRGAAHEPRQHAEARGRERRDRFAQHGGTLRRRLA